MAFDPRPLIEKLKRRKSIGKEAADLLRTLGASGLEVSTLLGIGAVESAWDWSATGAAGERGFWQIEFGSEEKSQEEQSSHALRQLRDIFSEMSDFDREPWSLVVDRSAPAMQRLARSVWQRGAKLAGTIQRWLQDVKKRWDAFRPQGEKPAGVNDKDWKAQRFTSGGKLGVTDLISWAAEKESANKPALQQGAEAFRALMEAVEWQPESKIIGVEGGYGAAPPSSFFQDVGASLFGGGPSVYGEGSLGGLIRGIFQQVAGGVKAIVGGVGEYVLPTALLVLGGGLAFRFLSDMWRRGNAR